MLLFLLMKKLIILFFIFFSLHSEEISPIQIRYIKAGTELGIGYRWHKKDGFDLSLNVSSIGIWNYFSVKALYLQFPQLDQQRFFYWGAGTGLIYEVDLGGQRWFPSLEGAVGYEFCTDKNIKCFLQLGLSVPVSTSSLLPVIPALSFGIGF